MLKKLGYSLLLLPLYLNAFCNEIPSKVYVDQHWLSWTTDFDIYTEQHKIGCVHRKFFTWNVSYEFKDIHEIVQATANMRFFTFGAVFDVKDQHGHLIGIVEEKIFKFLPAFDIIGSDGQVLAKAKMNFWGTKFTMTDPHSGHEIAILSRNFFRLKDDWTADIKDKNHFQHNQIDPRLFITMLAFQSDVEYWSNLKNNNSLKTSKKASVKHLVSQLENVKPSYEGIDPSEDDMQFVEGLTEAPLAGFKSLDEACAFLQGLLDSPSLTASQKAALYLMMEKKLSLL